MNKDNFAVLMAGGVGSRFWPVSTAGKPKQFRDLLGTGETLIQTTFRRLRQLVPSENILVLTNERYCQLVKDQLPEVASEQIVLEPVMRNTAPAVLLAALKIWKRNPEAVMVMAPSDHWIENEEAFARNIEMAFEACREEEKIITLGIKPTFPNTGYGYIQFKEQPVEIHPVQAFTEKPDYQKAREFLAFLKEAMQTNCIRHTNICKEHISKVALCGGAGSFLLESAIGQHADVFITGDFKYHDFFEADSKIIVADIGHFESEQFTKDLLYDILSKKFANIALRLSEVQTNPINYL